MSRKLKLSIFAAIAAASLWGVSTLSREAEQIKRAAAAVQNPEKAIQNKEIVLEADVAYGQMNGKQLLLDVMHLPGTSVRPALLLLHGGGWQSGSKEQMRQLTAGAAQMGYVSFAANYRLASPSGNKWPAQIDDVQRAVRWIRANARKYGVDPARVGVVGASAGGHLAALLGTIDTRDNTDPMLAKYSSKVQCVVDFFGPADFTARGQNGPTWQKAATIYNLFGKTPAEAPSVYQWASPAEHVSRTSAPFLIFHGTKDPLVPLEQSELLYKTLKKNGVDAKLVKMEGVGHGLGDQKQMMSVVFQTQIFLRKFLKG
jgi:acetyl esterase/lipase